MGVISDDVYDHGAGCALVSTVSTAPLLRLIYPDRLVVRESSAEPPPSPLDAFCLLLCVVSSDGAGYTKSSPARCFGQRALRSRIYALEAPACDGAIVVLSPMPKRRTRKPTLRPMIQFRRRSHSLSPSDLVCFASPVARHRKRVRGQRSGIWCFGWHRPLLIAPRCQKPSEKSWKTRG